MENSLQDTEDVAIKAQAQEKRLRIDNRRRTGLVFFTALYTTFFAGAFFGWGPMQLMLETHGAFDDLCDEGGGEDRPCPSQTTRLLLVQLIAQLTLIFSPLLGMISDRFGSPMLVNVGAACAWVGLSLLTVATSLNLSNMLFGAFILLGFMATSASVLIVQTGLLFDTVPRQRIISALNTLFDAGGLTYLALWGIQKTTQCPVSTIAGGYLGLAVVCFGGAVYLWRVVVPVDDNEYYASHKPQIEEQSTAPLVEKTNHTEDVDGDALESISNDIDDDKPCLVACNMDRESEVSMSSVAEQDAEKGRTESESDQANELRDHAGEPTHVTPPTRDYALIAGRSPKQQLLSKQYMTLCFFFALHASQCGFTMTTARAFLAYLGDDETGNKYLTIFTLLTPASVLGLPFMDWILNHHGYHAGLQSINVLALAHGIIMVSSENLNVQVLGFIVFSFFRCFMFSISFSFLPTFLGNKVIGTAAGMLSSVQGVFGFVNIPLASWAVNGLGGNFFYPNLIYTLSVLPCILAAWSMGKSIRREDGAKSLQRSSKRLQSATISERE